MNHFFKYLLSIGILFPNLTFTQVPHLEGRFVNYNSTHGLEPDGTHTIIQDSIGKIWVGTNNGLYSFDGKKFNREDVGQIPLRTNTSVNVQHLAIDGQHRIWVGTNQGLWFRDSQGRFQEFFTKSEIANKAIGELFVSPDKKYLYVGILISKKTDHLAQINLTDLSFKIFKNSNFPSDIRLIWQEEKSDKILVAYNSLLEFSPLTEKVREITNPLVKGNLRIYDLEKYGDKYLITSSTKGIFLFNPNSETWLQLYSDPDGRNGFKDILQKNDSTFYVACSDRGFGEFHPKSGAFSFYKNNSTDPTSIPIRSGRKIFIDRDKNTWIAMNRSLSFYNQRMRSSNFYPIPKELDIRKTKIADMATSADGSINVLGLTNHEFLCYDEKFNFLPNKKFKYLNVNKELGGTNLVAGNHNNIFASDRNQGLLELNLDDFTVKYAFKLDTLPLPRNQRKPNSLRKSPDGTIWVTIYGKGIIKYNDASKSTKVIPIDEDPELFWSYEMGFTGGKTFVSSFSGIHQIINDEAVRMNIPDSIVQNNRLYSITGVNDSTLAIGANVKGLFLFNHLTEQLTHIPLAKNSENIDVQELELDHDGNLWGITSKGFFALPKGKKKGVFFYATDGLNENSIKDSYLDILPSGKIMVSARTGFNIFDPRQMLCHPPPRPIQISSINEFSFFKNPNEITLPPDRPYLNLNFGDFNFEPSSRAKYFYKLLPQQPDWKEISGDNQLSFPQLASGNYTLQLKTTNRWNESSLITSLEVNVKAHFWKTWNFIILSMLIFAGIVAFITNFLTRKKEQEKALRDTYEKELNQMELRALRAHMNPHFLFNSLNSIRFFIQKNDNKSANSYISKFSKLLRFILNHSNKNTVTLTEELEALKLYLEFENLRFDDRFSYKFKIAEDVNLDKIQIQPLLLQPIIENAIWHGIMKAEESGNILIEIFKKENQIHIAIEDDGVGIDFVQMNVVKQSRLGFNILEKRIELFNSKNNLQIEYKISNINPHHPSRKGTKVLMKIFEKYNHPQNSNS